MIKTYWQESNSREGGSWLITFTIAAKINVKIKVPIMTVFKFRTSLMVNETPYEYDYLLSNLKKYQKYMICYREDV